MTIEVGTVLRHETGNEYTVMYVGDSHGIAKLSKKTQHSLAFPGSEMSFHVTGILTSTLWTIVHPMPEVSEHYYMIVNDTEIESGLEICTQGPVKAWQYVCEFPDVYIGVVRVNPDHTWDYVNENGDVQS